VGKQTLLTATLMTRDFALNAEGADRRGVVSAQREPGGVLSSSNKGLCQAFAQVLEPHGVMSVLANLPVFVYAMKSLVVGQRVGISFSGLRKGRPFRKLRHQHSAVSLQLLLKTDP